MTTLLSVMVSFKAVEGENKTSFHDMQVSNHQAKRAPCCMQLETGPKITARPARVLSFPWFPLLSFIFTTSALPPASPHSHGETTKTPRRVLVIFWAHVWVEAHAASLWNLLLLIIAFPESKHAYVEENLTQGFCLEVWMWTSKD